MQQVVTDDTAFAVDFAAATAKRRGGEFVCNICGRHCVPLASLGSHGRVHQRIEGADPDVRKSVIIEKYGLPKASM